MSGISQSACGITRNGPTVDRFESDANSYGTTYIYAHLYEVINTREFINNLATATYSPSDRIDLICIF